MFRIIRESLRPGVVTTSYPATPAEVSSRARGRPVIDWSRLTAPTAVAASCPAGAFLVHETAEERAIEFDLGRCLFCGLCAEADPAIRMTNHTECAVRRRETLRETARYRKAAAGGRDHWIGTEGGREAADVRTLEALAASIAGRAAELLGHSLHIRQVDAGSCNGCEVEIGHLTGPVYDLERFGIHLVASPRHADMLLVTGPVTRNMELALQKTYAAMPAPRLVVAVGACGCSGGMFGENYATRGAVDAVLPVDVYIPGCPPNPHALLHGILLAIERAESR